jgi:flagellar hook assembly protein FlgD
MMRPYRLVAPTAATAAGKVEARAAAVATGTTQFRAPSPNPGLARNFRFNLANAGQVEVDLYTVAGRLVSRLAHGWYSAGEHTVAWRPVGSNGETLANGIYLVRFRGDGVTRSHKLVISR